MVLVEVGGWSGGWETHGGGRTICICTRHSCPVIGTVQEVSDVYFGNRIGVPRKRMQHETVGYSGEEILR